MIGNRGCANGSVVTIGGQEVPLKQGVARRELQLFDGPHEIPFVLVDRVHHTIDVVGLGLIMGGAAGNAFDAGNVGSAAAVSGRRNDTCQGFPSASGGARHPVVDSEPEAGR